ncbi:ABC transporter ATP-binding protein [Defluviimonas sp. WL0002]|uniref:Spermidine/putrescine import ATP-binding protein PotA n=1 Tax=Albidovulum marisflavi TaxID=2984159 RepID=A0ABT2ZCY0_9RHOB|nr:ABC transporter ATP-binding protein [Defluviimonas sp. WL0002]
MVNVTKAFGTGERRFLALGGVNATIRKGEFFTLLGPSGCGKTTLLRLIAGFELPTSGEILLDGQEIGHLPPYRRPVNTVFQNYALFPHMTVAENISFGLEMLNKPKAEIASTVERMLALVKMSELAGRRTDQLSGGQQQRVALARALAPQPKVLLLDEPLSALDLKLRKEMQVELKRIQHETGITFIFVTHDQEEALTMSDRIAVMAKGNILQIGSPSEIYNAPAARFVADFIGDINFIEGQVVVAGEKTAQIRLPGGQVLTARASRPVEGPVTLAIRPEKVGLRHADDDDVPLSGTVTNLVYFGSGTNVHVDVGLGADIVARATAPKVALGDRVGLDLHVTDLSVLAE